MEITSWQIYWLTALDGIKCFVFFLGIFMSIFSFLIFINHCENKDHQVRSQKLFKASCIMVVGILMFAVYVFIPTTKRMAVIIVAPKIINNQSVQKLPNKLIELSNEWLEELRPKSN